MTEIPRAVLSEHFQERMQGRRLRSAVFLTYQFNPGFFEQEILPVFIDIPLSHATVIRLVQLEDALRALPGQVAVYYDSNGLVSGGEGSAKLDIRRVPVQHRTGIFHPKNVFLLVEEEEADESGYRTQALLIASLSANLTRSGWWENVEACQVEELSEGDKSCLKDDLVAFLSSVRKKTTAEKDHTALGDILKFLKQTEQRLQKTTNGELHPHFYFGREPLVDFLDSTAGKLLHGTYLEILSPYFDDADSSAPLEAIIERFSPKEVRLLLPQATTGELTCRKELFDCVRAMPGVHWGRLPKDVTQNGKSENAGARFVHAKLYRFFTQSPKREWWLIGSANLTTAAHQSGGNIETGLLIDRTPLRRPDFWLEIKEPGLLDFKSPPESETLAASGGTRLNLRYHWDRSLAEVYWDDPAPSPHLRIEARGIPLGRLAELPSREWIPTTPEMSRQVEELLEQTSLFEVYDAEEKSLLLVQEEGMSHKPSMLMRLSAADILRYWSLLTAAQRAAFLDARAPEIAFCGQGADLVTRAKLALEEDTIFDRFAGFFHAFSCLERSVREALAEEHDKEATYRLFGKKYDSLGSLLDRVSSEASTADLVDSYVVIMCARQLCHEIASEFPEYWADHNGDIVVLEERFSSLEVIRARLLEANGSDFLDFLSWFDRWFLNRAQPKEVEE